jgi:hypothetical protein
MSDMERLSDYLLGIEEWNDEKPNLGIVIACLVSVVLCVGILWVVC